MAAPKTEHYRREIAAPKTGPTIIVEDGTGMPNANSYVDMAYVQDYHDRALYATEWNNATPDMQTKAILEAALMIDRSFKFKGYKGHDPQAMEWPRIYAVNSESLGVAYWLGYGYPAGNYWGANQIPPRLKQAQAELAGELLKKDRTAEWSALGIGSVGLGQQAVTVNFTGDAASVGAQPFTPAILDLLSPLGYPRSGSAMAQVQRG